MSALLSILFLTLASMSLYGNGLSYGDLLSTNENRDDYYEDYYLKKVPKLKTTPEKVREFFVNHLSWFPVEGLEEERGDGNIESNIGGSSSGDSGTNGDTHKGPHNRRSYFFNLQLEGIPSATERCNFSQKVRTKFKKFKNCSEAFHYLKANWTKIKSKSSNSAKKIKNYLRKKNLKAVLSNVTHPFRYRGPFRNCTGSRSGNPYGDGYRYLGPSIRIHPKSSHVQAIRITTSTEAPFVDTHFSIPRKIKVIIDLNNADKTTKTERNVNEKYIPGADSDSTNSSNVLETAGEMASDLAGRVTSLWHCVLGSHHIPDTRDVKFYLYTRRNVILPELLKVDYDLISRKVRANPQHMDVECIDLPPENIPEFERVSDENRKIIKSNFLNIRAPTKILIHGYTGSYKDSRMAKIKDAYLSSGRYNVIQVDWEMLAAPPCYIRVTHHSKFVGETIAKFLDGLHLVGLNMSLVHLVGFSLGAQVAGFAGNNATIIPVCRITGLDPALPLFLHTQPSGHLDRLDAKFVDVIHTCGGILAMLDPLGHVDFYPNGGTRQPGCEFSNLKCSHSRAPQYFAESVVSQRKFTGQLCISWEKYVAGDCNNNTYTSYMGEPCSRKSVYGKYYLLTKSKEPFVL